MKAAVYCGTRNLYPDMVTAAKSLLIHSDVEQIYFLIEDNEFPYELPPKTSTINISGQTYFVPDGPNYNTSWTYMVLIRAALSKVFPDLDTVLSLDVDTIVNENISDIWDIDLSDYYLAAGREPCKSRQDFLAINMGVALLNLKKLRDDHKDDEIIEALNTIQYDYNEQDCIAEKCQGHIFEFPPDYNMHNWADYDKAKHRKIYHFAAVKNWREFPLVKKYRDIEVKEFNVPDKFGLDIIIPAYNDLRGLKRTLDSIVFPEHEDWINIFVIDDCSTAYSAADFWQFARQYPTVFFKREETNYGPGGIRNIGRRESTQPYIMFIDCGDICLSKWALSEIQEALLTDTVPYIHQWPWVNGEWHTVSVENSRCTPGIIYKREFLDLYDIWYCTDGIGAYANEDVGFNHICFSILEHISTYDETPYYRFHELPIYKMVLDRNSLTHANGGEFNYKNQLPGLAKNSQFIIKQLAANKVNSEILLDELNTLLIALYRDFLYCTGKYKNYAEKHWPLLREFYLNTYQQYENMPYNNEHLSMAQGHRIKELLELNCCARPINVRRFIQELKNNENCPTYYLT